VPPSKQVAPDPSRAKVDARLLGQALQAEAAIEWDTPGPCQWVTVSSLFVPCRVGASGEGAARCASTSARGSSRRGRWGLPAVDMRDRLKVPAEGRVRHASKPPVETGWSTVCISEKSLSTTECRGRPPSVRTVMRPAGGLHPPLANCAVSLAQRSPCHYV